MTAGFGWIMAVTEGIAAMNHKNHDYLDDLLSRDAVFGVIALLVQPWLLGLRAGELTNGLILTNIANRPFITLGHFEIGTCPAMGLTLTLFQMIGASVYISESPDSMRRRYLKFLSGSGWVLATGLELALSVIAANGALERAIGFTLAMLLTQCETCAGILVLDALLLPLALSIGWAIRRWFNRKRSQKLPAIRG